MSPLSSALRQWVARARPGLLLLVGFLGLPGVASAQQAETIEYYGTDAIGSIRIVWDASGNVTARQDFTPFGEPVLQQGTAIPKEGFVGNETDAETNQDYFHARMFEARTGRFTRPDPIEDGVGEPQRWNRYAYALNNPAAFVDAMGLNADASCDPGTICVHIYGSSGCDADICVTVEGDAGPDDSFWTEMTLLSLGDGGSSSSGDQDGRERGGGVTTTTPPTNPPTNPPTDPPPTDPPPTGATISAAPATPPTSWYKNSCITSALSSGALSVGIDAIGLLPEAGGFARILGHQGGYVGVVADRAGSRVIKAVKTSTGVSNGLAGLGDTSAAGLASTGLTVVAFIPGFGQAAAAGSIGVDVYRTVKAIGQCY